MYKNIKYLLWIVISVSVSILFLPTLSEVLGIKYNSVSNNWQDVFVLVILLSSIFSGIFLLLIYNKEKKAKDTLIKAVNKDAIWDVDSLTYHTRMIFYKVQSAWNNNDPGQLHDYFTPEFLEWFTEQLDAKTKEEQQDQSITFDITETNIICCQDFLNNSKDNFAAYIKGNLIKAGDAEDIANDGSFTDNNGGTWTISTGNTEKPDNEFSEIYHFNRFQNDWLLNKIDFKISIWSLLSTSNKFEQ